jgi:Tfp pilus assembly protein PilF
MFQRALKGFEKALGPDHTLTLDTVHNLGVLYADQGKLDKAEEMYQRALKGFEKALDPDNMTFSYVVLRPTGSPFIFSTSLFLIIHE